MINFGDWQSMPDYREGWANKHKNAFGGLLRALDPMTYFPSGASQIHDVGDSFVDTVNQVASPVVGGLQWFTETTTPGMKQSQKLLGTEGIDRFVRDKPFDAAALAAATFFTGGAASSALGGGAGAGTGAAGGLGASGTAAASNAITPAFASGAYGAGGGAAGGALGSGAASAITPAFASGAYGTGAAGGIGAAGGLGATGAEAASNVITPAFSEIGANAIGSSAVESTLGNLLNTFKPYYKGYKMGAKYKNALQSQSMRDFNKDKSDELKDRLAQQMMQDYAGNQRQGQINPITNALIERFYNLNG